MSTNLDLNHLGRHP